MNFFSKTFSSYDEFQTEFSEYLKDSYQTFSIRSSTLINQHDPNAQVYKYKKVLYVCMHGLPLREGRQKDGSRPN